MKLIQLIISRESTAFSLQDRYHQMQPSQVIEH